MDFLWQARKPFLENINPTYFLTMNSLLKSSLRIASAGLFVSMLYLVVRWVPAVHDVLWAHPTVSVMLYYCFNMVQLLSIALACFALFFCRYCTPVPDKGLRILVYVAAATAPLFACGAMLLCQVSMVSGQPYLYMELWQHCVLLGLTICILLKLSSVHYVKAPLSRSFSVALLVSGILPCVVLLLMLVSGIHVLFTGHVIGRGLGSSFYASWLNGLIPAVLFPWYAVRYAKITTHITQ